MMLIWNIYKVGLIHVSKAKTKNYYGPMIIQTDKNNYLFSVKKESLKKIDFLYFITESVEITVNSIKFTNISVIFLV